MICWSAVCDVNLCFVGNVQSPRHPRGQFLEKQFYASRESGEGILLFFTLPKTSCMRCLYLFILTIFGFSQGMSPLMAQTYKPLAVQFPCDVTIQCEDVDDLKATGEVIRWGGCGMVGVAYKDQQFKVTDACLKILRTWTVNSWCDYEDDNPEIYPTAFVHDQLNRITFTSKIDSLILRRNIGIGHRVTMRYVTSGTTEIPGLVEGDVYSLVRVSDSTFLVDYNTTKQQPVNITGQGVGPHLWRYANSELGLSASCEYLQTHYPFGNWYTACCSPASAHRAWVDDGDGYFRYTQIIKVIDTQAPTWDDCSDVEFCSYEADCGPTYIEFANPATDQCTPGSQLTYTYQIDLHNDGTIDRTGTGYDVSDVYPLGQHRAVFTVTDRCGNWNTCTRLFTIRDCKKPTPICIDGVSVSLMATADGGMAEIWAKSLESGYSKDNCTKYKDLIILLERRSDVPPGQTEPGPDAADVIVVTCDDLPPTAPSPMLEVVLWVGDEAGNWDYCITTIWVQDNMGACSSGSTANLLALVQTSDHEGIEDVELQISGYTALMSMTNALGYGHLGGIPLGEAITLIPSKNTDPLNGVSTLDLLLMQKHILGIRALNGPFKMIAADVDRNGKVTLSDILELRKRILDPGSSFAGNTSWRFVNADYVFPRIDQIGAFPASKTFGALGHGELVRFVGVKIGDVSGDALPGSLLVSEVRQPAGVLEFRVEDLRFEAGQLIEVPVRATEFREVQGYQYALKFDPTVLILQHVEPLWSGLDAVHFGRTHADQGMLTTSWHSYGPVSLPDGELLYTLRFVAQRAGSLAEVLRLDGLYLRAEAYDRDMEVMAVALRYGDTKPVTSPFKLHQNVPNPFSDVTTIGFTLSKPGKATLTVMDATGRTLSIISGDYPVGYSEVMLMRQDIPARGLLYYRLETEAGNAVKMMIAM